MGFAALPLVLREASARLSLEGNPRDKHKAQVLKRVSKKLSCSPPRRLDKGEMRSLKDSFPMLRDILSEGKTEADIAFIQRAAAETQVLGMSLEVQ